MMECARKIRRTIVLSILLLGTYSAKADVIDTIGGINNLLYGIAAGIAALMITLHGIKWKTASSPADREEAKRGIINVILGLIIIIIAASIVGMIYEVPEEVNPPIPPGVNCDFLDGWYVKKGLGATCIGSELCTNTVEKEERDYSSSGTSCTFNVLQTKTECENALITCAAGKTCQDGACTDGTTPDCDQLDGWYTNGPAGSGLACYGTQQCRNNVEKEERDYYESGGKCEYSVTNTKTECDEALVDCPTGEECANGLCVPSGSVSTTTTKPTTTSTKKPTTTSTTTTTTTTSTTTTLPQLTAKELVDCIKNRGGRLYTLGSGCSACVKQKNVFEGETSPPVGPGATEYTRLSKSSSGSPSGYYPTWSYGSNYKVGCKTFAELNNFYGCGLQPVPGHSYKSC
ncbi:MAG: hypothetical protein JW724_06630 [Candidatus Altiarchaeota archaeon]|nr:hypothetical protein [Candidatus Altiarchaeota archaeon]